MRQYSISHRLGGQIFFCVTALVMFILLFSYYSLSNILHAELYKIMNDDIASLKLILDSNNHDQLIKAVVSPTTDSEYKFAFDFWVKITKSDGSVYAVTPGKDDFFLKASEQVPKKLIGDVTYQSLIYRDKVYLLGLKYYVSDNKQAYHIVSALDVTTAHRWLGRYRDRLIMIVVPVLLLITLLSIGLAKRSLAIVRNLVERVDSLNLQSEMTFHSEEEWPEELQPLVVSLNEMQKRFHDSYATLIHFSGLLAHELRTPIQRMLHEAEFVMQKERTVEEYQEAITKQIEKFSDFKQLIKSLLILTRINSGSEKLKTEFISMRSLADKIISYLDILAEEKGVTLSVSGDAQCHVDPTQCQIALYNCVSNALRFTPAGKSIAVDIAQQCDKVIVTIADQGSGISPEDLPHVFQALYSTHRSEKNMGLGLALTKAIVNLHGGEIDIASEVDVGTTIVITLPL